MSNLGPMFRSERFAFYADLAAARHGCTRADVLSKSRRCYPARVELTERLYAAGWTSPTIARYLKRDHTTVLYALGRLSRARPSFHQYPCKIAGEE